MNSSTHGVVERHSLKERPRAYIMRPSLLINVQASAPNTPSIVRGPNSPSLAKAADNSSQRRIPGSNNFTPLQSSPFQEGCKTMYKAMENVSKEPALERAEIMKNGSTTGLKRQEYGTIKDGGSLFHDEPRTMSMRERGTWAGRKTNVQMPIHATGIRQRQQQQQPQQQCPNASKAADSVSSTSLYPSHPEFRCSNCGSFAVLVGHEESAGDRAGSSCSAPRRMVKDYTWQQQKMQPACGYNGTEKPKESKEEEAKCCRDFHDHRLLEQTFKCKIHHVKGSRSLCKLGHLCQKLHHPDCVLANQMTNCYELQLCSCGLNGGPSLCRSSSSSYGYCPTCTDLCFCCHQHITSSCGRRTPGCLAHNCCFCPGCANTSSIFHGGSAADELLHSSARSVLELETFSGPLGYVSESKGISLAEQQMIEEELLKKKRRNATFGRGWWRRWKNSNDSSTSAKNVTMDMDSGESHHCSSKKDSHVCQGSIHGEQHNSRTDEQSSAMHAPKQGASAPHTAAPQPASTSFGCKTVPKAGSHHHTYARHSSSRKWRLVKLCHYMLGIPMQRL